MTPSRSVRSNMNRSAKFHRDHSPGDSSQSIEKKKTKVIGGHAMAIRDLNNGTFKEHKLESHGKIFIYSLVLTFYRYY